MPKRNPDLSGYKPSEDDLQIYAADLIRAFKRQKAIAYHVPNGGKRHISVAVMLKKFGTLAGVPDWACINIDGLPSFLELKDDQGKQSDAQKAFQAACEAIDVPYVIARTPEAIRDFFISNGIIRDPRPVRGARGARVGAA